MSAETVVAASAVRRTHEYTGPQLADLLVERGDCPWISLRLGTAEVVRAKAGSLVTLMAPTGAGKTSLAVQFAWTHALEHGPVVFISAELDAHEIAARVVSQRCGVSWEAALRNQVTPEQRAKVALPRLRVLEDERATLAALEGCVEESRRDFPDEPVLVVVDYVQIMAMGSGDIRAQTARFVEDLRRATKRLDVVTLALTQGSRSAARSLTSGERVGADTTDAGAETAQIERAAYVTLALGTKRDAGGGSYTLDLNVGKERLRDGDRVVPVIYHGPTGVFTVSGPSRPAHEVRTERRTAGVADEIVDLVLGCPEGFESRNALCEATGGNRSTALAAIRAELGDGGRLTDRDGRIVARANEPGSSSAAYVQNRNQHE